MSPALIAAILAIVEEAIKNEPAIAQSLKSIFEKANPTPADWKAERDAVLANRYEDYVPDSQIPAAAKP